MPEASGYAGWGRLGSSNGPAVSAKKCPFAPDFRHFPGFARHLTRPGAVIRKLGKWFDPLPVDVIFRLQEGAAGLRLPQDNLAGVGVRDFVPNASIQVASVQAVAFGSHLTGKGLVVLGILIAINYIGAKQNKRWDLTANKQFGLSDQTRNVLQKLDAPLQIIAFDKDDSFGRYRDRLKEYEYASKKVTTEYIDPEKKPATAGRSRRPRRCPRPNHW